jgi:hypothetical protein
MTDPTVPEPTPEPNAESVPAAPPVPPAPAAPAYAPATAAAGPKQTMSIVGFVLGLVAFVFGWTLVFGLLVGIAAIIVSVLAHRREPAAPAWMWIIGLIGGILGAITGVIVTIIWIVGLVLFASAGGVYNMY